MLRSDILDLTNKILCTSSLKSRSTVKCRPNHAVNLILCSFSAYIYICHIIYLYYQIYRLKNFMEFTFLQFKLGGCTPNKNTRIVGYVLVVNEGWQKHLEIIYDL